MDHEALARLEKAEHFAHHVSAAMEAVATLMEGPDPDVLDYTRVPEMFARCPHCTVEGLLYLATRVFRAATGTGAQIRREIPTVVGQVLGTEVV